MPGYIGKSPDEGPEWAAGNPAGQISRTETVRVPGLWKGRTLDMERRTDLALEAAEQPVRQEALTDEDVERDRFVQGRAALTRIRILSERGERALGKPRGTYITAELPALTDNETELEETARLIGGQLASLLPEEGTVLVVGLGNEAITPDALGPQAVKMVLATRAQK